MFFSPFFLPPLCWIWGQEFDLELSAIPSQTFTYIKRYFYLFAIAYPHFTPFLMAASTDTFPFWWFFNPQDEYAVGAWYNHSINTLPAVFSLEPPFSGAKRQIKMWTFICCMLSLRRGKLGAWRLQQECKDYGFCYNFGFESSVSGGIWQYLCPWQRFLEVTWQPKHSKSLSVTVPDTGAWGPQRKKYQGM